MKICFVHDWLTTYGGAELVLKTMLEIWPGTPIYTLIYDERGNCRDIIRANEVKGSFINKLPFAKSKHRSYLPLMPLAIEQFNLSEYDLIISDSHAVAKGVITGPDQLHISYVHTPIRYAWDLQHQYLAQAGLDKGIKSFFARSLLHYIRLWDMRTACGVDDYVVNSQFIARRIKKLYKRESTVIYPPVEIDRFSLMEEKDDFYLTVSRLVPYKKVDVIIQAFNEMPDRKLVVIGDGPALKSLKKLASRNIEFLGFQDNQALASTMQRAKALIYAAEEDFGIVPVEAQACGTPVIAYGKGGVLETVIEGETGYFFQEQNAPSLVQAVETFEQKDKLDCRKIQKNTKRFSKDRFMKEMKAFVETKTKEYFR